MNLDTTKIILRKAGIRDIDLLIDNRIIFLSEIHSKVSDEEVSYLRSSLRKYFKSTLRNGKYICWIAEYNNIPVSFGGLLVRDQPGTFEIPDGKIGYIMNMYTAVEYRNKGLASIVFRKLIEVGKNLKLDRLELRATAAGEPVYRKAGFSEPHVKTMDLHIR